MKIHGVGLGHDTRRKEGSERSQRGSRGTQEGIKRYARGWQGGPQEVVERVSGMSARGGREVQEGLKRVARGRVVRGFGFFDLYYYIEDLL